MDETKFCINCSHLSAAKDCLAAPRRINPVTGEQEYWMALLERDGEGESRCGPGARKFVAITERSAA